MKTTLLLQKETDTKVSEKDFTIVVNKQKFNVHSDKDIFVSYVNNELTLSTKESNNHS